MNNLKPEETKCQIKGDLSYLANSYFYNYKPPRVLCQHHILQNFRKNKDIIITKPGKGNGVVVLDKKLYDDTIPEIISDTSKFEKLEEVLITLCIHFTITSSYYNTYFIITM